MKILLDTSFLMAIAIKPIKKVELLEELNGEYIILSAVIDELNRLKESKRVKRAKAASAALKAIDAIKARVVDVKGKPIDDLIVNYARVNNAYVATIDSEMRRRLREEGVGIITLSNDRVVFE